MTTNDYNLAHKIWDTLITIIYYLNYLYYQILSPILFNRIKDKMYCNTSVNGWDGGFTPLPTLLVLFSNNYHRKNICEYSIITCVEFLQVVL